MLDFATRSGARAIGFGDELGTVEKGKRADLVLLKTDRLGFSKLGSLADRVVTSATQADVDTVLVAGKTLKSGGKLLKFSQTSLAADAAASRTNVLERASRINLL